MLSGIGPGTELRRLEIAVELQLRALAAIERLPGGFYPEVVTGADFAGDPGSPSSRSFRGTSDQLAAVRSFVRTEFAGHPALHDAVLAASELAANAIAHTASGLQGGTFGVHLAMMSRKSVAILVTDEGGPTTPEAQSADSDAESGRGLDIVTSVSSLFVPAGGSDTRSVLAVITADSEYEDASGIDKAHQPASSGK